MYLQKTILSVALILISLNSQVTKADYAKQEIGISVRYQDAQFGISKKIIDLSGSLTMNRQRTFCMLTLGKTQSNIPCRVVVFNVCTQEMEGQCVHGTSTLDVDTGALRKVLKENVLTDGFYSKRTIEILERKFNEGACRLVAGTTEGWCRPDANIQTFDVHGSWNVKNAKDNWTSKGGTERYSFQASDSPAEQVDFAINSSNLVKFP